MHNCWHILSKVSFKPQNYLQSILLCFEHNKVYQTVIPINALIINFGWERLLSFHGLCVNQPLANHSGDERSISHNRCQEAREITNIPQWKHHAQKRDEEKRQWWMTHQQLYQWYSHPATEWASTNHIPFPYQYSSYSNYPQWQHHVPDHWGRVT